MSAIHTMNALNLTRTNNLGIYLGFSLIVEKGNNRLSLIILDKINKRIHSWKNRVLNLVDRFVFLKSTLCSSPIYFMQVKILPQSTLKQSTYWGKKKKKNFLWNDRMGKKKMKLINRKTITKPLIEGGLNIPNPYFRNIALSANLAW